MRRLAWAGLLLCAAAPAQAQTLRSECSGQPNEAYCQRIADAAVSLPARMAVLSAGGNPLAGSTGTLGMRMPGSPRVSALVRGTIGQLHMPDIATSDGTGELSMTGGSVSLDAGVGVFDGLNLAPTVGGFASLDVLVSIGLLNVPDKDGLSTSSSFTWAAGARVGILRESFTAPGVSVSALYRSIPDVSYSFASGDGPFDTDNGGVLSLRGAVGKRVLGIAWTGGVGYDRVSSDVDINYGIPGPLLPVFVTVSDEVTDSRLSYFGNAAWTTSVFNFVLELGWQQNGDRAADAHGSTRRGGLFGGAAIRLTI
jgi:hypothetical protein